MVVSAVVASQIATLVGAEQHSKRLAGGSVPLPDANSAARHVEPKA